MSNTSGPLRGVLEEAMDEWGVTMGDLTVLAIQNDPYRIDTPAGHRDGQWFKNIIAQLNLGDRTIHLRGVHYAVLSLEATKPDGALYTNTPEDWAWLQEKASDAARWLEYVPFDQIVDQRNAPAKVIKHKPPQPEAKLTVGVEVTIPDPEDLVPQVQVEGFSGAQPYRLVFVGEKQSLEPVLGPIAEQRRGDLYLPQGEMSDTLIHQMAADGAADGRPMVVFYFSDADMSGWQMPISVGRKLQAFRDLLYPGLSFKVIRVALTPDQVREHGLPSTPLKRNDAGEYTDKRARDWVRIMGIEATEVDALAALQPDLLARMARDAVKPYFDTTLEDRVRQARNEWLIEAQAIVDANLDQERLEEIQEEARQRLPEIQAEIDRLQSAMTIDVDEDDLPAFEIPEAEVSEDDGLPLIDSEWSFAEQCQRLIQSKAYRGQ